MLSVWGEVVNQAQILTSKIAWLDDNIINAAQTMLKEQLPQMYGLQPPVL